MVFTPTSGKAVPDFRREELGLSQADFWKRVGVTQSGGSRYESGDRRIPRTVVMLLNIAYGDGRVARGIVRRLQGEE